MFKWKRLGKVFDPKNGEASSWMKEFAQSPSVLIFDTFIRMYFCTRPSPTADGQYMSYLSYIDLARDNLLHVINKCSKPILPLGGLGAFDEFGTNPISVIRNGKEVWVYYAGWTRCESVPFNAAIGLAVSYDGGLTFSRLGPGPVLSYSPDEPYLLGSPRIRRFGDKWYLWYVSGKAWLTTEDKPEPVYKIRMASSTNGVDWIKHGSDLLDSRLGADECQAGADVILVADRYHMFYSYRHSQNYKTKEGGYRIGYASSTNLTDWSRCDEMAGMEPSGAGWDSDMACYPHVFALDDKFYMLYQGNEMGRSGIGLAQLDSSDAWNAL